MSRFININNSAAVAFTNRLEKMRKSDLPVVINQTLNDAAFDVKQRTMPTSAKQNFTERNKSFFRSTSRVKKSSGFSINRQFSEVGFIGTGTKAGAVAGLAKQERGGTVAQRDFIPMNPSRTGNSEQKNVRAANRLKKIGNVKSLRGRNHKIKDAFKIGVGGHIVLKDTLFLIKKIARGVIKLTALYSFKSGRSVKVKATHFMQRASIESGRKLDTFFVRNAKKRIKLK